MCKKAAVAGLAQSLYDRLVMRLNMKPFRLEGNGTFQKLSRNLFYLKIQYVKQLCTSPAASNRGIRSVSLTIV